MSQQYSSLAWEEEIAYAEPLERDPIGDPELTLLVQKEKREPRVPCKEEEDILHVTGSITVSF